jgi:hypothetical protein
MNSVSLIEKFELPFQGFLNPILWQDGVGFSIIKDREGGYASLYKIGLNGNITDEGPLKKLWVTVTYGKNSDGGISLGSGNKGLRDPIDLEFHDKFFYNTETENFFHHSKKIFPHKILDRLEKAHLKPTRNVVGLPLRIRLYFWRKLLPGIIKIIDRFLIYLLVLVSGEYINKGDILKRFIQSWHDENTRESIRSQRNFPAPETKFKTPQTMTFFGFTATRWSVAFYCILQLLIYLFNSYYWKFTDSILLNIFKNAFLTLCYVVVSFAITESLVPRFLKWSIKKMPKLYSKVIFKRLSISI